MLHLLRIIDGLDDILGILGVANSGAYLLIIFLSAILIGVATLQAGLPGLALSVLLCGIAIAAATHSSAKKTAQQ